ncbi:MULTISPECIES: hypothetical protein [unclassified Rhodococcus (in: high G+C Gram-positive bacteria)]
MQFKPAITITQQQNTATPPTSSMPAPKWTSLMPTYVYLDVNID